jgi:hypothetical protein
MKNGDPYCGLWELSPEIKLDKMWSVPVLVHDVNDDGWSQYHDMQLADIDNDGRLELVTGKRYKAHNGNDPGDDGDVFTCYYKFRDNGLYRYVIDFSSPDAGHSGVGIYFWLADLDGSGFLDIVAPGKEGLYLFKNRGISQT